MPLIEEPEPPKPKKEKPAKPAKEQKKPKAETKEPEPEKPRKAKRFVPADPEMGEEDEVVAQQATVKHYEVDGPTYLMCGVNPINVVDSKALPK